jgi:hypothetical protein
MKTRVSSTRCKAQSDCKSAAIARITPDKVYSAMRRIRWPDGTLSDMANLSRANDAVARFNESLEREYRGRQKPSEAPYARLNAERVA